MQLLNKDNFQKSHPSDQPMLYGCFPVGFDPHLFAVVAGLENSLCALGFAPYDGIEHAAQNLQTNFAKRSWLRDDAWAKKWQLPYEQMSQAEINALPITLVGTDFQLSVWQGLSKVSASQHLSYSDFTHSIGKGKNHYRAVGTAIGRNPVSWLIPCHRVMAKNGKLHGYRWGLDIKKALLNIEAAQFRR